MDPFKITSRKGPEAIIQAKLSIELKGRDWYVKSTHGNMYQSGFPDLYCYHPKFGQRWVECKVKEKYVFTPAQLENFPMMSAHGIGIWILTGFDQHEIAKLFKPPNWMWFLDSFKNK